MTRKSSSCKLGTLIRKCCGRNAALFTLSLLLQLIAMPVYLIMVIHAQLRYTDLSDAEAREAVRQEIAGMLQEHGMGTIVLVFMAVLAGIAMFRYLHVKKQTDFFHALPVTRGHLFASHFLTGILAVVPSYLLSVVLSCGVCVVYGFADAIDPSILLLSVVVHLAGFLLVYTVSILAAIISGHTLVSLLVCAWFQFGLLAGYTMVDELLYVLYPARLIVSGNGAPVWLSPIFEAFSMIQPLGLNWAEQGYWKECLQSVAFCLVAAGVFLALSYYLNNIRKSEHTGLSIAFPKIEQPFKLYMVSVGAIAFSLVFQATMENWIALFISMAIGALITACIVEIVYDLDFHSLFHRWKSLAVYYVVCAVVLGCMAMDITHWNSTIPERDEIVSATLHSGMGTWNCGPADGNENDYEYYSDRIYAMLSRLSAATSSGYISSGSNVVEDIDAAIDYLDSKEIESADALDTIYDSASMGAEAMKHGRSSIQNDENTSYVVTFTLQNGKTFTRQYYMPTDTSELADNGADVRFSKEYREKFTEAAIAQTNKEKVKQLLVENYVDMAGHRADKIKGTKAISDILDTLYEETQELTKDYVSSNLPVLVIRAAGEQAISDWYWTSLEDMDITGGDIDDIIDIPVYACQTETLKQLGKYVDNLETGFGSAQIVKVSVENYDEYEESYTEYTDEEHIAKWKPYLIPSCCERIIDDVYMMPENAYCTYITVELADGTQISCVCWRNIGGIADIVGQPWEAG
ncbi:MAG: DUF6449 domain-containing protein [Eubacteriales bacterium]|nr:DUF6449 domain-containing protein [Eubacteriales bacterium]